MMDYLDDCDARLALLKMIYEADPEIEAEAAVSEAKVLERYVLGKPEID